LSGGEGAGAGARGAAGGWGGDGGGAIVDGCPGAPADVGFWVLGGFVVGWRGCFGVVWWWGRVSCFVGGWSAVRAEAEREFDYSLEDGAVEGGLEGTAHCHSGLSAICLGCCDGNGV
jgi:hypothetical protein